MAEAVSFYGHYCRAVLVLGFPFLDLKSWVLAARLQWLRAARGIAEVDFLSFDAVRQAAQCASRMLQGKSDYGVVAFVDYRFADPQRHACLPQWIRQYLSSQSQHLSTDGAMSLSRQYLREMAQANTAVRFAEAASGVRMDIV